MAFEKLYRNTLIQRPEMPASTEFIILCTERTYRETVHYLAVVFYCQFIFIHWWQVFNRIFLYYISKCPLHQEILYVCLLLLVINKSIQCIWFIWSSLPRKDGSAQRILPCCFHINMLLHCEEVRRLDTFFQHCSCQFSNFSQNPKIWNH